MSPRTVGMTYDEKGCIAVDPARDYGENHSR